MTSSTDGAIGNDGTSATWLRVDCGGYKDGSVDDIAGNDSVRPCLDASKFQKFYKIFCHIEFLDACIKH
jgi:hypothetical protein